MGTTTEPAQWEQPPVCRHTGDRITEKPITDPEPREICADCGQEVTTEPVTFHYAVDLARPADKLWEAIERGGTIYIADQTGTIIGQLGEPQRLDRDEIFGKLRPFFADTSRDPDTPEGSNLDETTPPDPVA